MAVEAEAPLPSLGVEEQQIHDTLTSIAASVRAIIPNLANPTPSSRASAHLIENQVKDKLAQLRCNIRDLELLAEEQDNVDKARSVEAVLKQHRLEYESLRLSISEARLAAKDAIDRAFMQQRKELLSGAALPALQRKPGNESEMVTTASDITASLRRTRQALAQQLDHAAANQSVMDEGNKQLSTTKAELSGQQQLIKEGNQGLKQLKRQSTGDRWLLWLGLVMFLLVAGYVGFKRAPPVVKAPINMAVRLTGNSVWQGGRMVYNGAAFAVRHVIAASKRAKGLDDDDDAGPIYYDPAATITVDSKKLQPQHSQPESDLIGTGIYDDSQGRAASSAFTTDAQLNRTHHSDDEGTNSSLPKPAQTFAQQAGIADTAHNRQQYAWLFLSTRQQLVAWMRENVHEEWALQWLPTSRLPEDLAMEAWAQARALQRAGQQDIQAGHEEPSSSVSGTIINTSGVISHEDRQQSSSHSSTSSQVAPPHVDPVLPTVTGVAEPVATQQSLADLVQHVSILQELKRRRDDEHTGDEHLQEEAAIQIGDEDDSDSSTSTVTLIASNMTDDGSGESGDHADHHSEVENIQDHTSPLPEAAQDTAGLPNEQHLTDNEAVQPDAADEATSQPASHRRFIKEAVASLLAEPTGYENNDADLWADLASAGFDLGYDSYDDVPEAEATEATAHPSLDSTEDGRDTHADQADDARTEAVHDTINAERTETDEQHDSVSSDPDLPQDSKHSDAVSDEHDADAAVPGSSVAADQVVQEAEQQAQSTLDISSSKAEQDVQQPDDDVEIAGQLVAESGKEEATAADDSHQTPVVEVHADATQQSDEGVETTEQVPGTDEGANASNNLESPHDSQHETDTGDVHDSQHEADTGDVHDSEDEPQHAEQPVEGIVGNDVAEPLADAREQQAEATNKPETAAPVQDVDIASHELEEVLPVDKPGVFVSQGTDIDPLHAGRQPDETNTHEGIDVQSATVGPDTAHAEQEQVTDDHDVAQPLLLELLEQLSSKLVEQESTNTHDDSTDDTMDAHNDASQANGSAAEATQSTAKPTASDTEWKHEATGSEPEAATEKTDEHHDTSDKQIEELITTSEQQEVDTGGVLVAGQQELEDTSDGQVADGTSMEMDAVVDKDASADVVDDEEGKASHTQQATVLDEEHANEKEGASFDEE